MEMARTMGILLDDDDGSFVAVESALAFALALVFLPVPAPAPAPVPVEMAAEPDSLFCKLEAEPGEDARAFDSSLLPNQRRFRALRESQGGQLLLSVSEMLSSSLGLLVCDGEDVDPFSRVGDGGGVISVLGDISTSSASRHHFRRLVYRPQPS